MAVEESKWRQMLDYLKSISIEKQGLILSILMLVLALVITLVQLALGSRAYVMLVECGICLATIVGVSLRRRKLLWPMLLNIVIVLVFFIVLLATIIMVQCDFINAEKARNVGIPVDVPSVIYMPILVILGFIFLTVALVIYIRCYRHIGPRHRSVINGDSQFPATGNNQYAPLHTHSAPVPVHVIIQNQPIPPPAPPSMRRRLEECTIQ